MKIILFTDSLGSGGAQRQLVGLAILLQEKGYEVKVCTYYDFDFYKKELDNNNVPNELIPGADNVKKRIWLVRNYFKRENPDWVIAYQETSSLVACVVNILLNRRFRLIVSERNTTQRIGRSERVRFPLYRCADAIVPNSYAQGRFLKAHYPWMQKKLKIISNFVDLNRFTPNYKQRGEIAKLLIVGSIANSKNTKGVIEACRILKERNVSFQLAWYGWTDTPTSYMLESKKLIERYQLKDFVEFKNKQLDIAFAYQEAEYYCMPSFYEGTPNVLCEAIASGLPVVSSQVCDNSIYTKENYNGYLFNPLSPVELADNIIKLISLSDIQYNEYCHNSRALAEERLSKERFVNQYMEVLRSN